MKIICLNDKGQDLYFVGLSTDEMREVFMGARKVDRDGFDGALEKTVSKTLEGWQQDIEKIKEGDYKDKKDIHKSVVLASFGSGPSLTELYIFILIIALIFASIFMRHKIAEMEKEIKELKTRIEAVK